MTLPLLHPKGMKKKRINELSTTLGMMSELGTTLCRQPGWFVTNTLRLHARSAPPEGRSAAKRACAEYSARSRRVASATQFVARAARGFRWVQRGGLPASAAAVGYNCRVASCAGVIAGQRGCTKVPYFCVKDRRLDVLSKTFPWFWCHRSAPGWRFLSPIIGSAPLTPTIGGKH